MPIKGVHQQLTLAVLLSVFLASVAICATLFYLSQKRSYRDVVRQSQEMVQAASLAFSQAMGERDEVLLDAFIHELQSREDLHISEAYVLKSDGKVVAHSRTEEYGKTYPLPWLLTQNQPLHLSEIISGSSNDFRVVSLLQSKGIPTGALVVAFSTRHLFQQIRSEMLWIIGTTLPILLLSGLGVTVYGRRMVNRLRRLQTGVDAIGQGEWDKPIEVTGSDEITQLTKAFNQMLKDLSKLRSKDLKSTETIEALNRDLKAQLQKVEQLRELLVEENSVLREKLRTLYAPGDLIGSNGSLKYILEQARRIASLPITVLITGESGTGKELLATYLHESGSRKSGPFIKVNCAALPLSLIESELFGHEKGAFTGAVSQKKGKFELANGGTLFLDEVGELPEEAQAKLLRALQQREIYRIGGHLPISVDVRVIAATNRNLPEEMASKKFREDLYYRLKVVELHSPPLRERLEELPILAQYFVELYSKTLDKSVVGISPNALKLLASYQWPGNIRELENMVARAVALSTTQVLGPEDFIFMQNSDSRGDEKWRKLRETDSVSPFESLLRLCKISPGELKQNGLSRLISACERIFLQEILERSKNQKAAGDLCGLSQVKIHRLIRKHRLNITQPNSKNNETEFHF